MSTFTYSQFQLRPIEVDVKPFEYNLVTLFKGGIGKTPLVLIEGGNLGFRLGFIASLSDHIKIRVSYNKSYNNNSFTTGSQSSSSRYDSSGISVSLQQFTSLNTYTNEWSLSVMLSPSRNTRLIQVYFPVGLSRGNILFEQITTRSVNTSNSNTFESTFSTSGFTEEEKYTYRGLSLGVGFKIRVTPRVAWNIIESNFALLNTSLRDGSASYFGTSVMLATSTTITLIKRK
jgi:hypothetical protein